MKRMTVPEVVFGLIGYTAPYGDFNIDEIRFSNQEELIELCRDIIKTLQDNSMYYSKVEASMQNIGVSARQYLIELSNELADFLE